VERSNGQIAGARIALANMGPTVLRAGAAEAALAGAGREAIPGAAALAADGKSPPSDTNATAEFRRHLAQVLVRRALEASMGA
jgi:carbon-monoxide dehydrogenase medium subunit